MVKVGITNNIKSRMRTLSSTTPFSFNIIEFILFDNGSDAVNEEKRLHGILTSANLTGFHGSTEWFIFDDKAALAISDARKTKGR